MSNSGDSAGSVQNGHHSNGHTAHAEQAHAEGHAHRSRPMTGVIRACVVVIAIIAAIWALQWGRSFLIPVAVAISLAFWLMPVVNWLERIRIPRALGAALLICAAVAGLGSGSYALSDDARNFVGNVSDAAHKVRLAIDKAMRDPDGWLHDLRTALADRAPSNTKTVRATETEIDLQTAIVKSSTTAIEFGVEITVVLFLLYFLLASGDLFKRKFLAAISGHLARRRITVEILNEIVVQFQRYLAVLVASNVAIGVLTWGLFHLLGVENAPVWGIVAGVLHLVPYLGPAITAAASFVVTSVQFNSLSDAFVVAASSIAVSALIGMVLPTVLASKLSNMNSVAAFTGLMFWGWLWGVPGLLIGTPLMMALNVVAERVEGLHWLSPFLSGPPKRERKPRVAQVIPEDGLTEGAAGEAVIAAPEVATEKMVLPQTRDESAKSPRDIEPIPKNMATSG